MSQTSQYFCDNFGKYDDFNNLLTAMFWKKVQLRSI